MTAKTYARIADGRVAELFVTDHEIGRLFHPSLVWIAVPQALPVAVDWRHDGKDFVAPDASPATHIPLETK